VSLADLVMTPCTDCLSLGTMFASYFATIEPSPDGEDAIGEG